MEMVKRLVFFQLLVSCVAISALAQFKNIKLDEASEAGSAPINPAIIINPKNPKNILIGAGSDKVYVSIDGGLSWTSTTLKSKFGVLGQAALGADSKGNVYYAHLSDPPQNARTSEKRYDRIVVQKSMSSGKKWDGTMSTGLNAPKDQLKPSLAIHPKNGTVGLSWIQFDDYKSTDANCQSNIMYSQLKWGKGRWTKPIKISQYAGNCADAGKTVGAPATAISADGRVYITWSWDNKIYFDRSMDGGEFWLSNDLTVAEHEGGWDIKIPGLMRANGNPSVKIDNSRGPFRGVVYLMWSDQIRGEDDTDIWIIRSGNGGDNWTQVVRVNNDEPGKHQFLPAMSIDPATGIVYILFYDRRDYDDNRTDVYLAYSSDGAQTFKNTKISESTFIPQDDQDFGAKISISAVNGTIAAAWTRMDDGKISTWASIINDVDLIPELKKQKQDSGKKKEKSKDKDK
ncbi:MAG TPA: sialidase family protein [Cyclobacteriaceae bacterium]|nr:sialidase family protein [Cyclobacteriaceae bacterium]